MHSTNYSNTFIAIAPDSEATRGTPPPERTKATVAALQYALIRDHPYELTSDDVLFSVYAERMGIRAEQRPAMRRAFFEKPQACLRSSDLAKKYGWGIHSDAEGRVALYGVETREYRQLSKGESLGRGAGPVTVKPAMRSRR